MNSRPTISGFSFIRNGISLDFPFRESLRSLLPICDEVVVAVGDSDDGTLKAVKEVSADIRIVETVWDEQLRRGGAILSQQTNIALEHCKGDWCVYLQGDEVLHEEEYSLLTQQIEKAHHETEVEALVFWWKHFFGSYDNLATGRAWYRRDIRAFKNTGNVISWADAQGFRKKLADGSFQKLRARQINAHIYHYGWVRPPQIQQKKQREFNKLWHDDSWVEEHITTPEFDYSLGLRGEAFTGVHPNVMEQRIHEARSWTQFFNPLRYKKKPFIIALSDAVENITGIRFGEYKNFTLIP